MTAIPRHSPGAVDAAVQQALARHAARPGALLPILHDLQHRLGCIPAAAVPTVADALNLSRAEVHGVISFYPDFRTEPAGRIHLKVCRAEACQSRGGNALAAHAQEAVGCALGETTPDGTCTLEAVYCLGLCAQLRRWPCAC
ncbi:NAD(P)H-dependent oxidoreductase subunit E [Achromobacter sp. GG226]|nr:NAD(P)H-dependent oxidoreductase subunit E [Verticiella sp. GG226]